MALNLAAMPLLGHDQPVAQFWQAYSGGKMAQSWIFCGPKGVGKASFAMHAIRELLSGTASAQASPQSVEAPSAGLFGAMVESPAPTVTLQSVHDPEHPLYRRIEARTHPDFLLIDLPTVAENGKIPTELSVDRLRAVAEFLRGTPSEGSWRIVLIDDADTMNKNAANALLKILEEPPPKSLIILIAATLGFFPPTIRSRCRVLRFAPLTDNVMLPLLQRLYPTLSAPEQTLLLRLAQGSLGQAEQIIQAEGLALYPALLSCLLAAAANQSDQGAWHNMAEKLDKAGETGMALFGRLIEDMLHPMPDAHADPRLAQVLQGFGRDFWLQFYADWQELVGKQQFLYLDTKQVWLNLMTRFAA